MKDFFDDFGFYFSENIKFTSTIVVTGFLIFPCLGVSVLIISKVLPDFPQFCEVRK
jgi:hypothetical protein